MNNQNLFPTSTNVYRDFRGFLYAKLKVSDLSKSEWKENIIGAVSEKKGGIR